MKENMLDKAGREINPSKYRPYDCRGGGPNSPYMCPIQATEEGEALPSFLSLALA